MCLVIEVELPNNDLKEIDRLIQDCAKTSGLQLKPHRNWKKRPTGKFFISEPAEGCACSMLHDDADWNEDVWLMYPEANDKLAKAVQLLGEYNNYRANFQACWAGKTGAEMYVTLDELVEIIATGRIGTTAKYIVA